METFMVAVPLAALAFGIVTLAFLFGQKRRLQRQRRARADAHAELQSRIDQEAASERRPPRVTGDEIHRVLMKGRFERYQARMRDAPAEKGSSAVPQRG